MSTLRTFTEECRREAARLAIESGRPFAQAARELAIGELLLGKWVKMVRVHQGYIAPHYRRRASLMNLKWPSLQCSGARFKDCVSIESSWGKQQPSSYRSHTAGTV